jgi:DNA helicase-2/ATP-dependent DNA helicase PcrA
VPAYCVFTDATLIAIAETRPAGRRELAVVPGVGTAKLARYADEVLAICADSSDSSGAGRSASGVGETAALDLDERS